MIFFGRPDRNIFMKGYTILTVTSRIYHGNFVNTGRYKMQNMYSSPICFYFMQFWEKNGKSNRLAHRVATSPIWEILDLPLNCVIMNYKVGSSSKDYLRNTCTIIHFVHFIFENQTQWRTKPHSCAVVCNAEVFQCPIS